MPFDTKSSALEADGNASKMAAVQAAPPLGTTPTMAQEVQFMNGLNPNGTIATSNSAFLNQNGESNAFKWGAATAGTSATVTYAFDPTSNFTADEKATVREAFANWAAVANITFVETNDPAQASTANIFLNKNTDSTAYADPRQTTASGSTLGHPSTGQVFVTVDVVAFGVDAPSAWRHEIGHAIGLGHGGDYNGAGSTPPTTQFSAFDDHQYTTMSYVSWFDADARYADQNPNSGTNWGNNPEGNVRTYSDSIQMLDILAIQQLYGVATATPFSGGQTYGFNSTVSGLLHNTYDFAVNTLPVVTLYNKGVGNTLDLSGYDMDQRVNINSGKFSDVGGLKNNIAIAIGTIINDVIGGGGNDSVLGNRYANVLSGLNGKDKLNGGGGTDKLFGGAGNDTLSGESGNDSLDGGAGQDRLTGCAGTDTLFGDAGADIFTFRFASDSTEAMRDRITDFSHVEQDRIDLKGIDADTTTAGNQAFTFIGTGGFVAGVAGQIAVVYGQGFAIINGDVDGNGTIDFSVRLDGISGANPLVASDFLL